MVYVIAKLAPHRLIAPSGHLFFESNVCPEGIHITDNYIIPLKERLADDFYDPLSNG